MKELTVQELKSRMDSGEEIQVIDVREPYEVEIASLGATHIPMGDVIQRVSEVRKDVPVVVHCKSGMRSASVINALETMHGYSNLYNLKGGILAWAAEIDPSLESY